MSARVRMSEWTKVRTDNVAVLEMESVQVVKSALGIGHLFIHDVGSALCLGRVADPDLSDGAVSPEQFVQI